MKYKNMKYNLIIEERQLITQTNQKWAYKTHIKSHTYQYHYLAATPEDIQREGTQLEAHGTRLC